MYCSYIGLLRAVFKYDAGISKVMQKVVVLVVVVIIIIIVMVVVINLTFRWPCIVVNSYNKAN